MQDQFMSEIHALLQKYNETLEPKGIQCSISKKYFETEVNSRTYNNAGGIFSLLDHAWDTHREKKYKHQHNRYHSLILTVSPTEKRAIKISQCKQYAFLTKKIERMHTGEAPEKKLYKQEKIINKIEKRLQKILKKADGQSINKICKESWSDLLRYLFSRKYGYKRTVFGKDRYVWDLIFTGVAVFIAVIVILACAF